MKSKSALPKITKTASGKYHAQVNYTTADGKRTAKSFTNADRSRLVLDIIAFQAEQTVSEKMTVRTAMNRYIDSKSAVLSPTTVKNYRGIMNTAYPDLMDVDISKLTTERLQIAVNEHAASASPKTVRNHYGLLSAALAMYRPEFNPRVRLPQPKAEKIRIPTTAEIRALTQTAHGTEMELPVILAATLGLRRSEIGALTPADVDFERGVISITKAMVINNDGGFTVKAPKTVSSKREVRPTPMVMDLLRKACEGKEADERLSVHPTSMTRGFIRLCKRAQITPCRFHDLRHYAASAMLGQGFPKSYVADRLGHQSERMVSEVYGHIMLDVREDLEERLETYLNGVFVGVLS